MKKIIFADFMEYNDPCNKLGNYHYARCFSRNGYEVLWMSCLYNKLMYFKHKDVYQERVRISTPKRHKFEENIYGFAVKSNRLYGKYPFCKSKNIVLNNQKYISKDIDTWFNKIGFLEVDILWISNPKQYWLTNIIKYKTLVFRIPDDFTEFGVFPDSIVDIENSLIDKADIICVTAKNLMKKVEARGKEAILLPNGCELSHFMNGDDSIPEEYLNDHSKKAIYVGAIGEWFDTDLIDRLAKEVNINIYIIGKEQKDLSKIKENVNVKVLGAKPYSEITKYIKNADVAIIPFINNDFTDRINPIKLFEYLACGISVVSTNMKEVRRLNSPAYVAKDGEDFINEIKNIIKLNKSNKNDYINFASKNSWDARYDFIINLIDSLSKDK